MKINVCGESFDTDVPRGIYMNLDCMIGLQSIPDKFFDLAIVDPPYGRGEDGGTNRSGFVRQKNGTKLYVQDGCYVKKEWDVLPNRTYFDELLRVSKNQIIWGVNYFDYPLPGGRIIWDKVNDGSDQSGAEIAYCSFNKRVDVFRYMWRGMLQGKSVWDGVVQQGNKKLNEKRIHPTQKPVALYEFLLHTYAKAGDLILDTHVGSASSLIACEKLGYKYIGFEIDNQMYQMSLNRLKDYTMQQSIFDFGVSR